MLVPRLLQLVDSRSAIALHIDPSLPALWKLIPSMPSPIRVEDLVRTFTPGRLLAELNRPLVNAAMRTISIAMFARLFDHVSFRESLVIAEHSPDAPICRKFHTESDPVLVGTTKHDCTWNKACIH
jgi:hypothetical protein